MTSRQFFGLLARHGVLVIVCAVLGAAAGLGVSRMVSPSYTVRTELFVASSGSNPQDRLQNGEYIRTRIASYAGLITAPAVLDVVRRNLRIPAGEAPVADGVTATNPLDTSLIEVVVTDGSASRAKAVADQIGQVANSVIAGLEAAPGSGSPANVTVVTPAVLPRGPDSPSRKLYTAVGLVLGILLGAGAGLLRDARGQRRRSSLAAEDALLTAPERGNGRSHADVGSSRIARRP